MKVQTTWRFFVLIVMFLVGSSTLFSQAVSRYVVSSGGNFSPGSSVGIDSNIGELMSDSFFGGGLLLTQGFEQAVLPLATQAPVFHAPLLVSVYPNPFANEVWIQFGSSLPQVVSIELKDLQGNRLLYRSINSSQIRDLRFELELSSVAPGAYILSVGNDTNMKIVNFKIIKV